MIENTIGMNILPENENQRLEALKRYRILDTPSEESFDNIAKLATLIFKVPVSLISIVDAERVFFKANVGMGKIKESNRGKSLCSLAVLTPKVTVFEDALKEPCLLTNPNVTGDFGLRFYAGAPLITADGFMIGTLCIIDKQPRTFTTEEETILAGLAATVMDQIELRLSALDEREETAAINEELAASNEELASSNDNIIMVNDELKRSNESLLLFKKELIKVNSSLAEGEERFRTMAEGSGILIAVGDESSNATYFSKAWFDITGRKMEDLLAFGWVDLIHPDDRERYVQIYLDAFKQKIPFTGEFRILSKQGGYRWLLANGQPRFRSDDTFAGYISACTDITEQLFIRQQLKDSEQRLQLLANNISQLTWITDERGYIIWYNKRWFDYTGTTFEEMEGWGWEKVQHPDYLERVKDKWIEKIASGEVFEMTFPLRSKYGDFRWFLTRAIPLKDDSGNVLRWFGTNTDITEQKDAEQRMNDFLSIVSHELKTPLTSLYGFLQILNLKAKKAEDEMALKMLDNSDKQVKKMTAMINGFLNVSRLEAGQIYIDKQHFDLAVLVKEMEEEILPLYDKHNIIFAPVVTTFVDADRDKIGQVISNVISNAVKYSAQGTSIHVACLTVNGHAEVSVKDQGMGIKPNDRAKLFERFYRVDSEHTKTIGGFGIGLYLCKEIIERHKGKIWVDSEIGKGSIFWFTLPVSDPNL